MIIYTYLTSVYIPVTTYVYIRRYEIMKCKICGKNRKLYDGECVPCSIKTTHPNTTDAERVTIMRRYLCATMYK